MSKKQKVIIMLGVLLAMLLSALDQTIVATAMPRIVQDLKGLEYLSWVTTTYLLTSTIMIPISAKFSDMFGRKRIFVIGILIFLIGSALSGASQNIEFLIAFRGLQGFGAGVLTAIAFTIIGDLFPPSERGKWQGLFGGVFGLASVIGPILGGWLTDNASWRWNFYINIPVGIIALLVIILLMPEISSKVVKKSIDYLGIITLSLAITTMLLPLVWGGTQYAWGSIQIIGLFALAAISIAAFIYVEWKAEEPLLPLDLFKSSIFTIATTISFFLSMGMFGAIIFIPLYAQNVLGTSATASGTILTPLVVAMILTSIVSGQFLSRVGKYKWLSVIGIGFVTIALYVLSTLSAKSTETDLVIRMIFMGLGLGICLPIYTLAVQNAFDHSRLAVATSSVQLFRNIGSTVGLAIMGSILNNELSSRLSGLSHNSFVVEMSKMSQSTKNAPIDINSLQSVLTPAFQNQIINKLNHLPNPLRDQMLSSFSTFIFSLKDAMAQSIDKIFFISVFIMAIAFICSFFLKEIPLRKTHKMENSIETKDAKFEDPELMV